MIANVEHKDISEINGTVKASIHWNNWLYSCEFKPKPYTWSVCEFKLRDTICKERSDHDLPLKGFHLEMEANGSYWYQVKTIKISQCQSVGSSKWKNYLDSFGDW
eukprot:177449_1